MYRPRDRCLDILDLLVDGPSSFAALYSSEKRLWSRDGRGERWLSVGEIWDAVGKLEKAGWIKAALMRPDGTWSRPTNLDRASARERYEQWLPHASAHETSVDEVGFWFEIQPEGRAQWEKWVAAARGDVPRWVLDQDASTATVAVCAEDLATAETALEAWIARDPGLELVAESRVVDSTVSFQLHDGKVVSDGVRVRCSYREVPR